MTELGPGDAVLAIALVVSTITDLRSQKIYNALTFPLMLTGLGWGLAVGDLWSAFLGLAVAFVLHFALFAMGVDRAGDAKLMMGVGAFVGVVDMLEASLWSFVVFAPMGLVYLVARSRLGNFVAALKWTFTKYLRPNFHAGERPEGTPLAKGPAILVGVVIARLTDLFGPLLEMIS